MPTANKKVLHLINGEYYSGAERVQDLLAQKLPENGYDVWIVCVKPGKFSSRCRCDQNKILDFPMRSRLDWQQGLRIGFFAREHEFDLIHTHTPRTAVLGYLASRIARIPLVHHLHSPTSRDTENRIRNWVNDSVETFIMKRADIVIAVSESLHEYLVLKGHKTNKITVVWNGVPSLPVLPCRNPPVKDWVICVVALFRPRKGLESLLQAMSILLKKEVNVRLRAIGEFESEKYNEEVLSLVESLGMTGNVEWVGFVNDIGSELISADIFVLPSLFGEGLPMVVLEAMAHGVPVLSAKVEGVPEALPGPEFGGLFEPGNSVEMASAIQNLIQMPEKWAEIRKNAYIRQRQLFSDMSMAKGVAAVYRRLIGE